jgi:hypothetical protein
MLASYSIRYCASPEKVAAMIGLATRIDYESLYDAFDVCRSQLEAQIELHLGSDDIDQFIALLDQIDGDWDLEPTMGYVAPGYVDECEPIDDEEASIGNPDSIVDQSSWGGAGAGGYLADCEFDAADDEPEAHQLTKLLPLP